MGNQDGENFDSSRVSKASVFGLEDLYLEAPDEPSSSAHAESQTPPEYSPKKQWPMPLNIVIQVVGSRGDVQPFLALAAALMKSGHRVRVATHPQFSSFVLSSSPKSSSNSLEFFPVGGDPADLMAYMVESPSLIPKMSQIRAGIIQRKRDMYTEMLDGFWRSCVHPDPLTNVPFGADAIIANPPSFAHVHCAQALGIPVHLMFTMPWSSTKAFPHPLANVGYSKADKKSTNHASYAAVEFLTWQGLGDLVNAWRVASLGLEPVPSTEGHRLLEVLQVPFTYCWSPSLVPKPSDWGSHIDVSGFFFRDPAPYTPPDDLKAFLESGPPPIYVGFGSIVVGGIGGLMTMVLSAIKATGVRAIISRGWSNLNGEESPDVFYVGDCPHEWLFQQVAAVIHHGGAGTTACGLRYGKPTTIVPFFGDQPFWGAVVADAGAGPAPIPYRSLTSQKLIHAIQYCLSPEAVTAASQLADSMQMEDGVQAAVDSFHNNLPMSKMACDFFPDQPAALAVGRGKKQVKMCRPVASILVKNGKVERKNLSSYRSKPTNIENQRWDPVTALSAASISTILKMAGATADIIVKPFEEYKRGSESGDKPEIQAENVRRNSQAPAFAMLPLPGVGVPEGGGDSPHPSRPVSSRGDDSSKKPGAMAVAAANGVGRLAGNTTKGLLVDIPLAVTEGLRAVPNLYGDTVKKHDAVEDFRSGVSVAGKTFCQDMKGGLTDIFVHTYKGKKEEGAMGAAKGLGKGVVSLVTKSTAATFGLVTYPAQGIYRSIWSATNDKTRRSIEDEKLLEGDWMVSMSPTWKMDHAAIVEDFEGLRGMRGR
ncbi:Sterol 3-beta-glucosyltransferase UGT80B1-like protein 5 [Colletotrichum truncatum]|uniref:Sterol 3-beta-glucosyltransferase UGT80B1-like protein 5 n=1 Tax=Colletotrichum truncatum TaxID=5467 RepID=A0ACC3Z8A1_COLTU|nr:Sterol 3-beta-glucosyltransferase UGT80B1-like protein 5 [Colletotrichum truncatum]KAF6789136.1 Sterol 3-beta-glucosyltransferase UGT80B1-like protein 5 [Colletotrichum truncatum]